MEKASPQHFICLTKILGIWILFLFIGMAKEVCSISSTIAESSPLTDANFNGKGYHIKSRKLKGDDGDHGWVFGKESEDCMNGVDDYCPIDPSPRSKASLRHGTIQHGTIIPFIQTRQGNDPRKKHSLPHSKDGGFN